VLWAALFNSHRRFGTLTGQPLPPGQPYARRPAQHIFPPLTNAFGCLSAVGAAALLTAFFGGWIFAFTEGPTLKTPLWWLDAMNGVTMLAMLALSIMIAWIIVGFGMISDVDIGGFAGGLTVVVVTGLALYGLHRPFQIAPPPPREQSVVATLIAQTAVAATQSAPSPAATPTPSPTPWHGEVSAILWGSDPSFGRAVLLKDNWLIVGAPDMSLNRGWVYVFSPDEFGAWRLIQELPGPSGSLNFGRSLALDGETLLVGSVGKIHVYRRTQGTWEYC
jgi:hypothetical protein